MPLSKNAKSVEPRADSREPTARHYGFRIVGSCRSQRRLVDWPAALAGYAACHPNAKVECEGFLSAFTFGDDFRQRDNGYSVAVKGFDGPCSALWLWFDIDADGELQRALRDARRLCAGLVERYQSDGDALLIFYSGSKGFHVGLPLTLCGSPLPSDDFHRVARRMAESIAQRLQIQIDASIYDRVRAFRAPNSRHPKTGSHKRRIAFDELLAMSLDAILRMAQTPEPFDVPEPPVASSQAVADWQAAADSVEAEQAAMAERRASKTDATLNRGTLAFIRDGAAPGDRHRLLYSAAANLAELGCPAPLAHALLSESALDCGLPPTDVRRQIDCGLSANSYQRWPQTEGVYDG